MGLFTGITISGSGLTAQRLRMDLISDNIANEGTTRSGQVDAAGRPLPYRRKIPVFVSQASFSRLLDGVLSPQGGGVRVETIAEDQSPFPEVYDPDHPDADPAGYVRMPNVNVTQEMVDLIDASRAYEANVSALNADKELCTKALEIGK